MLIRCITQGAWETAARCITILIMADLLWACSGKAEEPPPQAQPQEVQVIKLAPQPATITEDYVAQTEALNTVEIRPRVGGLLEKQAAADGAQVKQGQMLFLIDSQQYSAALAQAQAAQAQAEAAVKQSKRDLARVRPLSKIDAISQQELDAAVAKNDANRASVEAAQAAVKTAKLNLGYTNITSPIDGILGRAQIKVGGLVTAYTTLLATVYSTDPMYVNFSISERRLLEIQRTLGHAPDQDTKTPPPFRIELADGSEYPWAPTLNFIDPAVDQRTGTLAVRLEVANPDHLLRTGQFAHVLVSAQQLSDALLLPQRAVQELQGKNYVWIVDNQNKAQKQDVTMGARIGQDWLVQKGLNPGVTVIVDGVQKLKPGDPVKPQSLPRAAPAGTKPGDGSAS